ncbi:3,4-dihydroxy-2-butanone-4-phosphate synthase [Natrarchaeobius halalkaliphilus]|uniref:3,4-dihydroxy-2-butanone 4-phosphate synthase n=1 Tax=Natrarchaeobius halalkaliphilus TaxID=1679091 RepID=A0A3N6LMG4_9EURY|nr:3,4-dihydroxy-2-butanone-4-phosphate synthase [Natrarchaeobius halalkaliphilus]RQG86725.1 3,4-dihydroxy-2-butanone-4-phosphate synthase [Natrarchaeobius halalkaliphilus]
MTASDDFEIETDQLADAVTAFANGNPILAYDSADRENEVDIIYPAATVEPQDVTRLRNDAGGLICVALSDTVATALELPFARDTLDHPVAASEELKYDDRSAASITVNHRDTFTGITDQDRSVTINRLGALAADPTTEAFVEEFRSPGHVQLLRAAPNLLADRRGHTEFAIALTAKANRAPVAVVCEMLDDETGGALSPAAAKRYAASEELVYVDMSER